MDEKLRLIGLTQLTGESEEKRNEEKNHSS